MDKLTIRDFDVAGKRVFVRVDFNVPLEDGKVTDDSRIRAAIPTISTCSSSRAPGSSWRATSAAPTARSRTASGCGRSAQRLTQLLRRNVPVTGDALGVGTEDAVERLRAGRGAAAREPPLPRRGGGERPGVRGQTLAAYADVYVNDAFGTAHRAHASTVGVAKLLPAYAGLLMEREIEMLSKLLESPERPFAAIIGGAKVSDKIKVLDHLLTKVDMPRHRRRHGQHLPARPGQGRRQEPGRARPRRRRPRGSWRRPRRTGVQVVLPVDVIVAKEVTRGTEHKIAPRREDPGLAGTSSTSARPSHGRDPRGASPTSKTVFWNGPLGVFEIPSFAHGTNAMARLLADAGRARRDRRRRRRRLGRGRRPAGPRRQDDPHLDRRRRLARVPRGPRAARRDRPARSPSRQRRRPRRERHASTSSTRARSSIRAATRPSRSTSSSTTARSAGRRCRRAPRPAPTRPSSCATATRPATAARACCTAVINVIDTHRARRCSALDAADQAGIDAAAASTSTARPTRPSSARTRSWASRWPCAHAAAASYGLPLYRYLGGVGAPDAARPDVQHPQRRQARPGLHGLPGVHGHAGRAPTLQPRRCGPAPRSSPRCAAILHDEGHATGQGDEGGFAPSLALERGRDRGRSCGPIERAGYRPGEDVAIALDPAITELVELGSPASDGELTRYAWPRRAGRSTSGELVDFWADWVDRYPIVSLEDGLAEDDWAGWQQLTERLGGTRPARRRRPAS